MEIGMEMEMEMEMEMAKAYFIDSNLEEHQ